MKKFKILVKSRLLNEEMKDLRGGTTCTVSSPYNACSGYPPTHYTSCGPSAMPTGYESDGSSVLCGKDMNYGDSTCMGIGWWSTSCGTGSFYGGDL
ncbi:hypothetical protein FACS1894179_06600 [Bacteroidia bacterium]|nr:hypothetical protein FACS1894169_10680 [Bacteroidia bacterium]GHV40300.1 hypothetical protein FACS1894179_06600 [Bacteroidia bacterium]